MMDDLGNFKKLPKLFKNFWAPVNTSLKKTNPTVCCGRKPVRAKQGATVTLEPELTSRSGKGLMD